MDKNSKGFAHIFLVIAIVITALGGVGYSVYKNYKAKNQPEISEEATPTTASENVQETNANNLTITPSKSKNSTTSTPTLKPTATPIKTPTPSNTSSSCPYNLTVATGSVKVNIQTQSGSIVGDQIVELQAQSGCKVLVNVSADKDTRIARQGSPSVNFSTVPPGSYSIRIQYKGQWTSYQNIVVNSGQQTVSTFTVIGDTPTNTPTPTPKPKPTCYNPIIYPSSTGTAPYSVQLQGQGMGGAAGTMVAYEWDFTGNGSWDATGSLNPPSYTYQSPGTYTVKMRLLASNGEYSDICQSTVTVN